MKNLLLTMLLGLFIASCGDSNESALEFEEDSGSGGPTGAATNPNVPNGFGANPNDSNVPNQFGANPNSGGGVNPITTESSSPTPSITTESSGPTNSAGPDDEDEDN